jgi:small conductance mechanosensitive channel
MTASLTSIAPLVLPMSWSAIVPAGDVATESAQTETSGNPVVQSEQTTVVVQTAPPEGPPSDPVGMVYYYAPSVIGVLVILSAAWLLGRWLRRMIRVTLLKTRADATLIKFFSNVVKWAIFVVAVLLCMNLFGIRTTGFATIMGAVVLAIGLGFQGSLAHLASGVMLLIFRPFKVGDMVNIAGQLGRINEIDLFYTELDTPDGRRLVVPNSQVFGNTIENITHHPRRRVDIPVGVHYQADIDQTRAALERALVMIQPKLEEPPPEVILQELGASSVNWTLRVWTKREEFFATRQATVRAAKYALEEAGITIPFPQMDVHLRWGGGEGVRLVQGEEIGGRAER